MKGIILFCFISIFTLGMASNARKPNEDKITIKPLRQETFLTTFIENDQLYLNIPNQLLDTPMMFVMYDQSYDNKYLQIIWSLEREKIVLMLPSITSTAGITLPIKPKLTLSENILAIFPKDKDRSVPGIHCINITDLILKQEIPWKLGFQESLVPQISLVLETKDLKNEVIIKTRRGIMMDGTKISLPMFFAFCKLDEPMKARRYDYRMGFYNEKLLDIHYGAHNSIANISRWHLEKKYPNQEISVPKKPITFILSPDIPKIWRPYVKAGIEEWLSAFESAGFKEALVVKEVDSLSEWDMYSINNNIVYWGPLKRWRGNEDGWFGGTISNIIDERSGEILKGDIYMSISRETYSEMYFIRSAPLDIRAQTFPFPDDLVGELYQCMVAHEVGHVFGLMDANYGEFAYPFEKMNDVEWLKTMGHTPSVMNYTRQNNIAQPEDHIPPSLLNQKVGPMDRYQIRWGYTEFPFGTTQKDADAILESIIRLQDSIPWYRYNYSNYEGIGPADTDEVVESRDPVRSTEMALKNLERVLKLLPDACRDQKDNARLERIYSKICTLWFDHMSQIVAIIGGYDIQHKSINQEGAIYTPIALEIQQEALDFLIKNVMNPPNWLIQPEFAEKIYYSTYPDIILTYQQVLLFELLRPDRMKRFEYLETIPGYSGALTNYLTSLQAGLFKELNDSNNVVKPRNQELQMTYIDKLIMSIQQKRVNIDANEKTFDYTDYSRAVFMEQLINLNKKIEEKINTNRQLNSKGHWKICLLKLNKML
ncbi:zinc-dependent metalloprotease [Subsaxibacter sp. CAU 1640]|uniref:zinc-dependent metalloprotease n=1 Tax=Subsaxibacter sp. CAU 1640 TaxID=2933271 RepID=UPI002004CCF2|nr:zinc-dependent metalloprotease [Subsaxibacter sp. CAU 1640]MCK7591277.1 zinc-dependent metalloprotease [Subsaxibacter sp. CAU 1640]